MTNEFATRAVATALFVAGCLASFAASAQTYPVRPVTMLVPFPPGGATDVIARIIKEAMERSLGQPIVIENIGGAGGMIGAAKAARANPDGYTILIHQVALAAGMALYPDLKFDAEKDFAAIGLINTAATALTGRPTLPPNNFEELLRWMRAPSQNVKFGNSGVGSYGHLVGVLIAQELGVNLTQVPYRGAGPALVDLLAGEVDLEQQPAVAAGPLVKAGKLKAFAVVGRKRFSGWPELPTMAEFGYDKLAIEFWHILLTPAGTPAPVVEKLNTALRVALADAKVDQTFAEGGMDLFSPDEETPEAGNVWLKREIKRWGEVIRANHIMAQ